MSSDIAEAASVLLARGPGSREVFLVCRSPKLRFLGGFCAFPGGRLHADDAGLAGAAPGLTPRHVAAVRELFEEVGVLLARRPDGSFPPGDADLARARQDLLADRLPFPDLLAARNLRLTPADLTPAGSLLTPPFSAVRFNTAFFVADLPADQAAEVWPGELTGGVWSSADEALKAWDRGGSLLSPPTVSILETLRGRPVGELPERARALFEALAAGEVPPIWFSPAVQMIPLVCHQALPPGTHTNAYLVGTGPCYLLDPGPTDAAEQQRLFATLDAQAAAGRRLAGVVLTHHHPDHVGAAAACAVRYRVPVLAHPLTARALAAKVEVRPEVKEGGRLDLGPAPDGHGRWHLEALHTPGHAAGHLAFYEPRYGLLFAGDMVSGLSSVLIAPPEGDLTLYLASLRRLQTLPARLLLPAHGSPRTSPAAVLEECLAHRRQREEELLGVLGDQPRTVPDLAREVYRGLPEPMMRYAELQVLAGLRKLEREGRAASVGAEPPAGWVRLPPAV